LGICAGVWLAEGFEDLNEPYFESNAQKIRRKLKRVKEIIRGILNFRIVSLMQTPSGFFLFWGSSKRILQYLDLTKVKFEKLGDVNTILLFLMFRATALSHRNFLLKTFGWLTFLPVFSLYFLWNFGKKTPDFLSPIHEDNDTYGILAKRLGVKMFYMQDGYLPKNYTSTYLCYRVWAAGYHIFDRLSAGIFNLHNLNWQKKDYFRSQRLPLHQEKPVKIHSVVFLTSGAGDWTALKSRSDEDLAFEALLEVAKKFPDIRIIYRPHPLWTHPTHQGVNSIKRLFDYANSLGLKNFAVSVGALKEGQDYYKDRLLSRRPASITEEIDSADLVLGDHSQAILNAGIKGKMFASVNLARRTSFFCNYADLGFPLLKSSQDIIDFINGLQDSIEVVKQFNKAVKLYNEKYA